MVIMVFSKDVILIQKFVPFKRLLVEQNRLARLTRSHCGNTRLTILFRQ